MLPQCAAVSAFEAIVLGIVQGLTEFLPISSSGHLRIVPELFGWEDPGTAFTAVVQLGTMAAVVLYFRRDLWRIGLTWLRSLREPSLRRSLDARMGWYLIIGTIPLGVFGLIFEDQIQSGARNLWLVGSSLILLGLVLLLAERVGTRRKTTEDLDAQDGISIGFAQSLALVPGVSRSGATITAGLFLGYTRADAARFSFLLSVPAIVGSGLFELREVGGDDAPGAGVTLLATVAAFVVGYASIAWLLRWLGTHSTAIFVGYRVVLGTLVLILLAAGVISAS